MHHRVIPQPACGVLTAAAAAMLLLAPALPLDAQSTGQVVGRVTDELTGSPVVGAVVRIADSQLWSLTDGAGTFRITGVHPQDHEVEVRATGYATFVVSLTLYPGGTARLEVPLTVEPVELPGVDARARALRRRPDMEGFWRRRDRYTGIFFSREEIEARAPQRISDLFRDIPGAMMIASEDGQGAVHLSFARNLRIGDCIVSVFLNGHPYRPTSGIDEFRADEVEAIEVYSGSARIPAEFNRTSCGAVVFWTRRGGRR